jgi:multidrug efflux pump subunit AcrB
LNKPLAVLIDTSGPGQFGRGRVIPGLITALATVAGLFLLATGPGGKLLIRGPVATAIVRGLVFPTTPTLIVIPLR